MTPVPTHLRQWRSHSALALGVLASLSLVLPSACGSGAPFSSSTPPEAGAAGHDAGQGQAGSGGTAGNHAGGGPERGGTAGQSGGATGQSGGTAGKGETGGTETTGNGGEPTTGGTPSDAGGADSGSPSCAETCKDPKPYCAEINGTPTCINPAQALSAKRLELPCLPEADPVAQLCPTIANRTQACPAGGKVVKQVIQLGGDPNVLYSVTLHIRGVVEPRNYVGGKDGGNHFYVGGTGQQPSNYNTYSIAVSAPAQTFYLNADTKAESYRVMTLDHEKAIVVQGGASVTLQVVDPDCAMVKNCKAFDTAQCTPYVVTGVAPDPMAFNGQFVQLDVGSVTPTN